jgi:hypothetical protein
VLEWHEYVPNV